MKKTNYYIDRLEDIKNYLEEMILDIYDDLVFEHLSNENLDLKVPHNSIGWKEHCRKIVNSLNLHTRQFTTFEDLESIIRNELRYSAHEQIAFLKKMSTYTQQEET